MQNEIIGRVGQALEASFPQALSEAEKICGLEIPGNPGHGDFATNIALKLSKKLKQAPIKIAQALVSQLKAGDGFLESVTVAGPGFINFKLTPQTWIKSLATVSQERQSFGASADYKGKKALVEFVSANPTGPLHVGHGRNAVVGDTLASLLSAVGYTVEREYYVNDGGIQITTLGRSVDLRMRELNGEKVEFPENLYQGAYITDIAKTLSQTPEKFSSLTEANRIQFFGTYAGNQILEEIKADLKNTGVVFDSYFFESSLYKNKAVEAALADLKSKDLTYEAEGALWLASTRFGDDKDRVLIKNDGAYTYLTPDIAYHRQKMGRGYDLMVNIWGADHGGYVPRLKAAMQGLGYPAENLKVVLIQMVSLIRAGELLSMSTRRAQYETLEAVVKAVGSDAARFFFMMRSYQAQLEFDLELAKAQSSDNPVYYVQYAHARISSIFGKAKDEGKSSGADPLIFKESYAKLLSLPEEIDLAKLMLQYPQVVRIAAEELGSHRISTYALDLVRAFQSYYDRARSSDAYRVLSGTPEQIEAKLFLLACIRQVLQNAFRILGINAPEKM